MATPTYTAIASITLGSSISSVTFSSIPQDYRDLVLVFDGAVASGTDNLDIYLNSDTGSNYNRVSMDGDGSTASSQSAANDTEMRLTAGINLDTNTTTVIVQFLDYSATDKHKTSLSRFSGSDVQATAHRWANTNAITNIEFETAASTNFASGTTLALYGIAS